MQPEVATEEHHAGVRTFLIADVRGYTRFTREHGDAAAARLAKRFADLARDAVTARGGTVIELRGDEALAVFASSSQAVRAAVEFQATCWEETAAHPDLPLTVGIGIDVGEAIPVEDGYRGAALNTAARLCSRAGAGQVLVTRAVADGLRDSDEIACKELGAAELKGFETAVDVIEATPAELPRLRAPAKPKDGEATTLPLELDVTMPLVDREREMQWLRGTWRQARRGRGRVVFVSGSSQIGKTRLVAEFASHVAGSGERVHYAGPGGAAAALAAAAIRTATDADEPVLVVLDDVDVAGDDVARALREALERIRSRPAMVIGLVKNAAAGPHLEAVVEAVDGMGDGHLRLAPLDAKGIEGITRLYVGEEVHDVPLESIARASGGVPGRVHEVVSEWARDEAGRRLAAAAQWLAEGSDRRSADLDFANNIIKLRLGRLYSGDAGGDQPEVESPYKGLASFDQTDASYFFGRERLVGELAARTVGMGMLSVLGASGSGKSSAVAAGLLPSLRAGLLPGSERWTGIVFRPGEHPMAELRAAVAPDSTGDDPLAEAIERIEPDGRLVLAIDQFEELFTLCNDETEREQFIASITGAATRFPDRIVLIPTMRDDFYGRCAPHRELAELFAANHVLVPPMTGDELRRAIELPARRSRLHVEGALVDALVAEVADEPGGLPLLSAALVELWHAREDGWLRMSAYERTGGVRGAVARLAEASYQQLNEGQRDVARRILLRLAGIGEGDVLTRRRVHVSEFDVGSDPLAAEVLTRLTRDRLLTMSDLTVEVAHEALLREWPRLRGWLEDDVQGHQLHQHLSQAAKQWEAADEESSELYRGARLTAALDWSAKPSSDLNVLERAFLTASHRAGEVETQRQRRTNRRLRALLAGTTLFLALALVAGSLAFVQRGNAQERARIATARELAAAAVANLDVDPERSILLALAGIDETWTADRTVVPEAEEAMHRSLKQSRSVLRINEGGGLAVDRLGEMIATSTVGGTASLWDAKTGRRVRTLTGHEGAVNGIAFSPDRRTVVTTGEDKTIRMWEVATGRPIRILRGHVKATLSPMFSPDGRSLATSSDDGTVRLWDVASGRIRFVLRGPPGEDFFRLTGHVQPAFNADGTRLSGGGWMSAPIWDVRTGKIDVVIRPGHTHEVSSVAFSPDGRFLTTASYDGTARTFDARTGGRLVTFSGHQGEIIDVGYSADGTRIATASSDSSARVWDAATGKQKLLLAGHTTGMFHVAFTAGDTRLVTGGQDGTTRVWDVTVEGGRDWLTVPGPGLRLGGVAFSPDAQTFAVPNQDSGITIRDARTGAVRIVLKDHKATIMTMAFSPDGSRLAGGAGSGQGDLVASRAVPIWDVATGKIALTLAGHEGQVVAVTFSPDGRLVATAGEDNKIRLWDAATGKQQRAIDTGGPAFGVRFTPDARFLVTSDDADQVATIWDAGTFQQVGELKGHSDIIQRVVSGPGDRVLTASFDGTAKIWNLSTRREVATLRGHKGGVIGADFSPDGSRIATASLDGTAKLWDAATGREIMTLFGHDRIVHTVAFSSDGRIVATASGDGTVALHLLPIAEVRRLARERVTRGLTDAECRQYLHVPTCRART